MDYNSGPSQAQGLGPETADSSRKMTWIWRVGTRTAPGTYPITVTSGDQTQTSTFTVR